MISGILQTFSIQQKKLKMCILTFDFEPRAKSKMLARFLAVLGPSWKIAPWAGLKKGGERARNASKRTPEKCFETLGESP